MNDSAAWVPFSALRARRSRRRGRLVLPASPAWPHARWGARDGICLVTADPVLAEAVRGLIGCWRLAGLWTTPSLNQARLWLQAHPQCPLVLVDAAEGLWLAQPPDLFGPQSGCLPRPFTAGEIAAATRKFFLPYEEKAAA